jgi:transcription antitermination factor NusA-like protein
MLCSKCQTKIKTGAVTKDYMEVAKKLISYEGKNQFLQTVTLDNVVDVGGFLVLVVGKGDSAKFNANPNPIRDLGDAFNRRVVVIEASMNDRKFLEDLFSGQQIITINIIWLPDGSTETRVVLGARGAKRLSKKRIQALTEIAKKVRKMDLRVEYVY